MQIAIVASKRPAISASRRRSTTGYATAAKWVRQADSAAAPPPQVAHRLERAAVNARRPALADDPRVARRDVADVRGEAVVRKSASILRISRSRVTFATIEAAAIAALFSSPSTTARCGGAVGPRRKPSTRHASAGGESACRISRIAARFDLCSPLRSIAPCGMTRTTTLLGAPEHRVEQLLAPLGRALLRVVEESERPHLVVAETAVVEQHAGHDQRPGQAATTRLVGSGNQPGAELPVELQELLACLRGRHPAEVSCATRRALRASRRKRRSQRLPAPSGLHGWRPSAPGRRPGAARGCGPSCRPSRGGSRASRG